MSKTHVNARLGALHRLSIDGDGDATLQIALIWAGGEGVETNVQRVRDMLMLAVDQGCAKAMMVLSDMFKGIAEAAQHEENKRVYYAEMVSLLTRAVEKGLPEAMIELGHAYRTGKFVARNEVRAFQLYERAMDARTVDGMYWVGMCHARGTGTFQCPELAKEAFEIAARHDHVESMRALAVMYRTGTGVAASESKGRTWERKADRAERAERRRGARDE